MDACLRTVPAVIGIRSGSCGLLGNILILAHQYGIKLDQLAFQQQMLLVDGATEAISTSASGTSEPMLSDFLREWYSSPWRLCCLRSQESGIINWYANGAFAATVGELSGLEQQLEQEVPSLKESVDFLICNAEIFIATTLHPDDRIKVAKINSELWSQVRSCEASFDCEGGIYAVQQMEATESATVRCLVRESNGQRTFRPCTLQARAEYHADAKRVYSVFSLLPDSSPAPVPVPVPVPVMETSAAAEFQSMAAMLTGSEGSDAYVIDIGSLGLELAQADVDLDELAASLS